MREADDPVQSDHVDGNFSWNQLEVAHPLSPENTVKFSTYSDPLEWVILLEDRTTTESLNQSQGACRSIDHRIWLATVSHYVRGLQQGDTKATLKLQTSLRSFVRVGCGLSLQWKTYLTFLSGWFLSR